MMPIYRIRRYSGFKDGRNHYHHADVEARDGASALRAANDGRVRNWRWIDSFDTTDENYEDFELLYKVDTSDAVQPRRPLSHKLRLTEKKVGGIPGVASAFAYPRGVLLVTLRDRKRNTYTSVAKIVDPIGIEVKYRYFKNSPQLQSR